MKLDRAVRTFVVVLVPFILCASSLGAGIKVPVLHEDAFNSSRLCSVCHVDIYGHWESSRHSRSLTNPAFEYAYLKAYHDTKGDAKMTCLRCHAPTVTVTEDYGMEQDITQEGVTCDFCHSVHELKQKDGVVEYVVKLEGVKYGPFNEGHSPAHELQQRDFITTSRFCAGCHELTGNNGVSILSTYSEWLEGPLRSSGIQCQDCHMSIGPGFVVTPELQPSRNTVNLHVVPMSNSSRLRKAATIEIGEVVRKGNSRSVTVGVTNVNAGHKIPTGSPSRSLILRVNIIGSNGYVKYSREEIFRKTLLDEDGHILSEDSDIFLKAHSVQSDNRISPGETRFVTFEFLADDDETVTIDARLYYRSRVQISDHQEMLIEMASSQLTD